ncbi:MAG: hypothetical protein AB1714_22785 [Acidobacteriota bacterium]
MARKKRGGRSSRRPRPPKPTDQDQIKWGKYTLVYDPAAADTDPVEIKVRPVPREKDGKAPAPKILKLAKKTLVEDSRTPGAFPVFSKNLLRVAKAEIKADEAGDYASIWIELNRAFADLANFLGKQGEKPFEIRVTLFVDMTSLVGPAAGMQLPEGSVSLPIPGNTTVRIRLLEPWKISFKKLKWAEQAEVDLNKLPDVDRESLQDLNENGGDLDVGLTGIFRPDDQTTIETEGCVKDADVKLLRHGQKDIPGVYDNDMEAYVFSIPAPPGGDGGGWADAEVEVRMAPEIEQRLKRLYENAKKVDGLLQGSVTNDASAFIEKCLNHLAENTEDYLVDNESKFTNATHGVTYFVEFTYLTAKGFDTALRLHRQAYDRFMENLINGIMEILFYFGDKAFEKIVSRLLKTGKEVVEQEIKAEAKSLAEVATESAERTIMSKKQAAEAAGNQLTAQCRELASESDQLLKKVGDTVELLEGQQKAIAEKKAAQEALGSEVKSLEEAAQGLEKQAGDLAGEAEKVTKEITETEGLKEGAQQESERLVKEVGELEGELAEATGKLDAADGELKKVAAELEGANKALAEKQAAKQTADSNATKASTELASLRSQQRDLQGQLLDLERQETRLTTLVESGQATSEEMKQLAAIQKQRDLIEGQFEQMESTIERQIEHLADCKAEQKSLQGAIDKLDGQAAGLNADKGKLDRQVSDLQGDVARRKDSIAQQKSLQAKAVEKQGELEREIGRLQEELRKGNENLKNVREELEKTGGTLKDKNKTLGDLKDEIPKLQQQADNLATQFEGQMDGFIDKNHKLLETLPKATDKQAEQEALQAQLEVLQKVRQNARTMSQEQFDAALDEAIRNAPNQDEMTRKVLETLRDKANLQSLDNWEESLKYLKESAPGEATELTDRSLQAVQRAKEKIKTGLDDVEATRKWLTKESSDAVKGKLGDLTKQMAETIKYEIEERAKQIRKAFEDFAKSDYRAVPAKYYDDTAWGSICAYIDSGLEKLSDFWNWLVSGYKDARTLPYIGTALKGAETLFLYGITAFVVLLDILLAMICKVCEGILYVANSPSFAYSRIKAEYRNMDASASAPMPATLDAAFFRFSKDAVKKVADKVHPKQIANQSGGKAAITAGIKQEFAGAYQEYYEPQWERAKAYMLGLCGAQGALDPRWLTAEDEVTSSNRAATRLLQGILDPLTRYSGSFDASKDGALVASLSAMYKSGEWTPQDYDSMLELAGWALGWGIRLGSFVLAAIPGGAALIPGAMSAADWNDRISAALRVGVVSFWTMPEILGAQFDIMWTYSLAYQAVFGGEDVEDALKETPEPAGTFGGP